MAKKHKDRDKTQKAQQQKKQQKHILTTSDSKQLTVHAKTAGEKGKSKFGNFVSWKISQN